MTIREALLAMGYSERKPGHWMKPLGFQCFSYHEDKNEWANWFKSYDQDEIMVFETEKFKHDLYNWGSYLSQLKHIESYTKKDFSNPSNFELSAIDF
jgi:hypothetical protein